MVRFLASRLKTDDFKIDEYFAFRLVLIEGVLQPVHYMIGDPYLRNSYQRVLRPHPFQENNYPVEENDDLLNIIRSSMEDID